MILGGENVDILLVLIGFFMKSRFFRECVFFVCFWEKNWKKRVHGRIPWAQNSGNPCTKLIISLFGFYMGFFVF